jgi:hypothetical protein
VNGAEDGVRRGGQQGARSDGGIVRAGKEKGKEKEEIRGRNSFMEYYTS